MAMGPLVLVASFAASTGVCAVPGATTSAARPPGGAYLRSFGNRSAQQRDDHYAGKLDGMLADLSRHARLARPDHALWDLHSLSPAARFTQTSDNAPPLVLIDAVTRGDPQQLKQALQNLGLRGASVYANDVGGWLPVTQIGAAGAIAQVHSIRAAMPRTRSGAVSTQGDFAQRSDALRAANPTLTGTGMTVGVISDSFNCYAVYAQNHVAASGAAGYASNGFLAAAANDIASGDLPSGVNVVKEAPCMQYGAPTQLPFGDEGRAMLQIVHDVAPGAGLAFYTAENSEADFANGIGALAAAGAKVEADDVGYYDEPFFQDGIVAQAIDGVAAQGVAYFSAAGNDGRTAYDNTAPNFAAVSTSAPNAGEQLLNFDATGATTATVLPVTIAALVPGEFVAVVVQWDQPYVTGAPGSPGASSRIDVCVTGASGADAITDLDGNAISCTGPNALGADPVQILIIGNPANAAGNTAVEHVNLAVGLVGATPAPGRIKLAVEDDGAGSSINAFSTNSATLQGHPGAAGAAAVGAAFYYSTPRCGTSPAVLESYSSEGGSPILFDNAGHRLAAAINRQKPDFVGPDGGNDSFLGFTLASANIPVNTSIAQCQNNAGFPNFFGTSAATPHAAAVAALMRQANPAVTPTQIFTVLRTSASPMGIVPNANSGYGFIQADAALALLPPAAPALSLAASSVAVGGSTTLTWSSVNTTSCTASGGWSGAQATSGSQAMMPTAAGSVVYSLTCANAAGVSAASTVTLTVTAAATAGGGGGGGAIGGFELFCLAALAAQRRAAASPARRSAATPASTISSNRPAAMSQIFQAFVEMRAARSLVVSSNCRSTAPDRRRVAGQSKIKLPRTLRKV